MILRRDSVPVRRRGQWFWMHWRRSFPTSWPSLSKYAVSQYMYGVYFRGNFE
jgi:hypothetical protein